MWVLWLIAGCVLAAGEMATTGFFLAPFALGAFAAAAATGAGVSDGLGAVVFAVIGLLAFAFIRPVARRHIHTPPSLRTGTAALVGQPAIVLERIANDEGVGRVKIGGEVWSARSLDADQVIEVGRRVHVVEIQGATALVD